MIRVLKCLFVILCVRPFVLLLIGLNIYHRERLPTLGPHIIIANHNSHLDTLVLMGLMPLKSLWKARPVAAADYFMTQRWRCWWWALSLLGVVLLYRQGRRGSVHPMQHCFDALDAGDILILYPEGSRGCPEQRQPFKRGIVRLLKHYPQAGVTPVMLKGVGRVLPRGEVLPVPVNCDVAVGEPLYWQGDEAAFMAEVEARFHELSGVGVANQQA